MAWKQLSNAGLTNPRHCYILKGSKPAPCHSQSTEILSNQQYLCLSLWTTHVLVTKGQNSPLRSEIEILLDPKREFVGSPLYLHWRNYPWCNKLCARFCYFEQSGNPETAACLVYKLPNHADYHQVSEAFWPFDIYFSNFWEEHCCITPWYPACPESSVQISPFILWQPQWRIRFRTMRGNALSPTKNSPSWK